MSIGERSRKYGSRKIQNSNQREFGGGGDSFIIKRGIKPGQ